MSRCMLTAVDRFVPGGDETDRLLAYPFAKPQGSYITDGEVILRMPDRYNDFTLVANAYLEIQQLPLIQDRIPVIEFGSNSSPHQTHSKMAKYGPRELQPEMQVVPKIIAEMPDTQIVWHGKPGQKGSTFAEAYKGEDTAGKSAACTIGFYDEKQLAVVNSTEGITYELVRLEVLAGSERQPVTAYAYLANDSSILLKDGKPVPVKWPGEVASDEALSAEEAIDYMLDQVQGVVQLVSARDLIEYMAPRRLSERFAITGCDCQVAESIRF